MASRHIVVREMTADDLPRVAAVSDDAFVQIVEQFSGESVPRPFFQPLLFPTRLALDPAGCLVAVDRGAEDAILGAIFSLARGSVAWFGPLAVAPAAQGRGVGQLLTAALTDQWRARGVRLMGLETFGGSDLHIHLYSKFGYRPEWTSLDFAHQLDPAAASADGESAGVMLNAPPPSLDFVYEGLDLSAEATQTITGGLGVTLACDGGFAILHTRPTFTAPDTGYLLFAAAPSETIFRRLLAGAERQCTAHGLRVIATRAPTANWSAMNTLLRRGYQPGMLMARMKQGERPDYDAARIAYCDSWL